VVGAGGAVRASGGGPGDDNALVLDLVVSINRVAAAAPLLRLAASGRARAGLRSQPVPLCLRCL
jgi:hypothetical protein